MKITDKVSGFRWDEKRSWSIDGALAEKARQWVEEARHAREEEERRSESGSEDDEDDPEDIKALKV
jgi:hypothetical protein